MKAHFDVQRIFSARNQEDSKPYASIGAEKEICPVLNMEIATIIDAPVFDASTITEFTRILCMGFDKSWSLKICE